MIDALFVEIGEGAEELVGEIAQLVGVEGDALLDQSLQVMLDILQHEVGLVAVVLDDFLHLDNIFVG